MLILLGVPPLGGLQLELQWAKLVILNLYTRKCLAKGK